MSARLVDGVLELSIPSWLSKAEEYIFVARMQARFAAKKARTSVDLERRVAVLAKRYDLPKPSSVRWVSNQRSRWGSCSPDDGSIRISDRMRDMPEWVVDAVLVHELAHLVHGDHGPAFRALEARFERQVEASAFLDGVVWATSHGSGSANDEAEDDPIDNTGLDADLDQDDAITPDERDGKSARRDPVELQSFDGGFDVTQLRFDLREELGGEAEFE